jgi:hypothetical protein
MTAITGAFGTDLRIACRLLPALLASSTAECSPSATPMLPSRYRLPKRVLRLPQGERCALEFCRQLAKARFDDDPLQLAISIRRSRSVPAGLWLAG